MMNMLWETKYLHELAIVESAYEMHDRKLPVQIYGQLSYDKNVFRTFHGKKFHDALNKKGHDHAEFSRCKCRKK